jgi:hypothetical protein
VRTRKPIAAAAAAMSLLAVAAPVATASAATTPAAAPAAITLPSGLIFTPPKVGAITVDIGPTIIGGKVIDRGLHVLMPGASLPPLSWTVPAIPKTKP